VVLVSGAPGAGKTTVAGPLAAELGFGLLGKDTIKEVLADALELGAGEAAGASRRLGAAAMELMWALAANLPAVVLDANFWVDDERLPGRLRALSARPVEVHCTCPAELAAQRYRERSSRLHPVHAQGAGASPGTGGLRPVGPPGRDRRGAHGGHGRAGGCPGAGGGRSPAPAVISASFGVSASRRTVVR
jgi:predicted kinase